MRWGAEGPHDYHGRLAVTDTGGDGAQIEVLLSTERVESEDIQRGVDATIGNIKTMVEGRHGDTLR